jgi:hypothetical protein
MKIFLIDLGFATISALYWWFFVTIVFGSFGGDYAPNTPPPSEVYQTLITTGSIVIGVLIFTFVVSLWRRLTMGASR